MGKTKEGVRPLSQSEGFAHIENYYLSGLRPSEYYKEHGLTDCQFYGWRKRYLSVHPEAEHGKIPEKGKKQIHPVKIDYTPSIGLSGFEIHYPHGVRVVVGSEQSIEIDSLKELIKLKV